MKKRWYTLFTLKDNPVMGCGVDNSPYIKNDDDEIITAESKALFCKPDVVYDEITITRMDELLQ